ncbi:MAG: hypothetical protein CSA18_02685 [Deltaproteobacteria bacterium]|nr:MAG: hypothetical protein CSA18_02685 [Deltaproteobacteria bacterium]
MQNITATGDEDTKVQLQITGNGLVDDDGSESIISAKLTGVPEGYLVFVGDDASAPMAGHIGNGTWSIPLNNNELPAYIAVLAPDNESGTHTVNLKIYSGEEGETPTETTQAFTLTVNPVADGVTINPTQTSGSAGNDIGIHLNATMEDTDGSETVTLTLKNFGVGENVTFNAGTASYDENTDTFTITDIAHDELGSLTFNTQYNVSDTITVTAKTVETGNNDTSGDVTATFDVSVTGGNNYMPPPSPPAAPPVAPGGRGAAPEANEATTIHGTDENDTLDGKGGADELYGGKGDDTIILDIHDTVINGGAGTDTLNVSENVDFTSLAADLIVDMEGIDLTGNGQQTIDLDKAHVESMTGDENTLLIKGDTADGAKDMVNLERGWTDTHSTEVIDGVIYNVLENDGNYLKIEDGVNYNIA